MNDRTETLHWFRFSKAESSGCVRAILRIYAAVGCVIGPLAWWASGSFASGRNDSGYVVTSMAIWIASAVVVAALDVALDFLIRSARANERSADALEQIAAAQRKRRGGS